jgi:hypothetical protein
VDTGFYADLIREWADEQYFSQLYHRQRTSRLARPMSAFADLAL